VSSREFLTSELIRRRALHIGDGYRAKNSELAQNGIPFARSGNINNGFHFEGCDFFPVENLGRVGTKVSEPGDVVFTSKGTVGRFAYVDSTTPQFVYSPQLCYWRSLDRTLIDSRWLYYWMHGKEFYEQYNGAKGQTDMADYVSLTDQRRMHISLPPLAQQKRIAHILGTLDDKIELNRRMCQTLEEMARALFKSWFVDFDPVRAKAEGRQPAGMDAATAALFPDSFVDSELGAIPKGWEVKAIGDVVEVVGGSTPSTSVPVYWDGPHSFATPKDLSSLRTHVLLDTERRITHEGLARVSSGLLPVGTVLLSSRAPIGYLAVAQIPVAVNQGFIAMKCSPGMPSSFVLLWARHNMETIIGNANGTTFLEVSKRSFRPIPIVRPSQDVLRRFGAVADERLERIVSAERSSLVLAELRDALLPRLLSSERTQGTQ